MEIIERDRVKPWWQQVVEIPLKGETRFAYKHRRSVRGAISHAIKYHDEFKHMEFETKTITETVEGKEMQFLEVKRIK